jgi:hypothetical protein
MTTILVYGIRRLKWPQSPYSILYGYGRIIRCKKIVHMRYIPTLKIGTIIIVTLAQSSSNKLMPLNRCVGFPYSHGIENILHLSFTERSQRTWTSRMQQNLFKRSQRYFSSTLGIQLLKFFPQIFNLIRQQRETKDFAYKFTHITVFLKRNQSLDYVWV